MIPTGIAPACCKPHILDPAPTDWKELQDYVAQILRGTGIDAAVGKDVRTPRGQINLDVHAIDSRSDHPLTIVVECKNWCNNIPQSVVHAFHTVMTETGANIGYLVSSSGFQKGAVEYSRSTSIRCVTFSEFQEIYFESWFKNSFVNSLGEQAYYLHKYTDPMSRVMDVIDDTHWDITEVKHKRAFSLFPLFMAFKHGYECSVEQCLQALYEFDSDLFAFPRFYADVLKLFAVKVEGYVGAYNAHYGENLVRRFYP